MPLRVDFPFPPKYIRLFGLRQSPLLSTATNASLDHFLTPLFLIYTASQIAFSRFDRQPFSSLLISISRSPPQDLPFSSHNPPSVHENTTAYSPNSSIRSPTLSRSFYMPWYLIIGDPTPFFAHPTPSPLSDEASLALPSVVPFIIFIPCYQRISHITPRHIQSPDKLLNPDSYLGCHTLVLEKRASDNGLYCREIENSVA